MNKDFIVDYCGCILLKVCGPIIRAIPLEAGLFLGRRLGDLFYYLDPRHRAIAYANIKAAVGSKLTSPALKKLTRRFYRTFGQNLIEVLFIPLVDRDYIRKYINIEGQEYVEQAFRKGKGVIMLAIHAGSWELSSIICASLGFPFRLFIRNQRYPNLNRLLNSYRSQKGCQLIERDNETRELIRALGNNQAIGLTADQGGKNGVQVKFFGRFASMPSGAVRLALKYDATLIPAFYTRIKGPYIKVIVQPPFEIKRTGNLTQDIRDNLQALVGIFEKQIEKYPQEYLWTYKIWKYSSQRNILIINDGKAGHLRQAQAVAQILQRQLATKGIQADIDTIEVKFKNRFFRFALTAGSLLGGRYQCQGCLWCMRSAFVQDSCKALIDKKPDIVISCGSSLAAVNYLISRENCAKSIVIMRPSVLSVRRFDLVLMNRHDNPPKRKNVTVLEGALNFIDEEQVRQEAANLKGEVNTDKELVVGLLIGGNTKHFRLKPELIKEITAQLKNSLQNLDGQALITTSRRTPADVEGLLKNEFAGYNRSRLLVIANEKNIPGVVSGILGLSRIVVVSPESISMISEAVYSGRYVVVFQAQGLGSRHRRFLEQFSTSKYLYLARPEDLTKTIETIWYNRPEIHIPDDKLRVGRVLSAIL